MAMFTTWMRSTIGTYVDNPTSKRDYRAQLRGSRAIILWTIYLVALIGIGMLNYASTVSRGEVSIVEAQRSLQDFYQLTIILLASMIVLVSPALAATAIVIEKERRSLDLIFSAPVKPKTLLVGKMISAYRYTWMLLVLSLPVTAVCVVLGGSTWSEVLATYALLSFHALLFSAMALLISSLANKPVGALVWTYISVGIYSAVSAYLAALFDFGGMGMRMGTASNEGPFVSTLSPFFAVQSAGMHTTIWGIAIPNWILFAIYALFFTRLLLLGAASALSPFNSWETKNLRLTSLVSLGLLGVMIGYVWLSPYAGTAMAAFSRSMMGGGGGPNADLVASNIVVVLSMLLLVPLPFIVCSGLDGERKFWPNGTFKFGEVFRGTPSGGLPFLLLSFLAIAIGVLIPAVVMSLSSTYETYLATLVWGFGFWVFCWSLGRWASSTSLELKSARTIHLALLIVFLGLPIPFLAIIDTEQTSWLWKMYPLYALWADPSETVYLRYAIGVALLVIGGVIAILSNRKLQVKLAASSVTA